MFQAESTIINDLIDHIAPKLTHLDETDQRMQAAILASAYARLELSGNESEFEKMSESEISQRILRRFKQEIRINQYGNDQVNQKSILEANRGFSGEEVSFSENQEEANRQYDEVVARYKETPLWMKAPNGKSTNLTERQWVVVRTSNFKEWFGDWESDAKNASVVKDENGEPKPVYIANRIAFSSDMDVIFLETPAAVFTETNKDNDFSSIYTAEQIFNNPRLVEGLKIEEVDNGYILLFPYGREYEVFSKEDAIELLRENYSMISVDGNYPFFLNIRNSNQYDLKLAKNKSGIYSLYDEFGEFVRHSVDEVDVRNFVKNKPYSSFQFEISKKAIIDNTVSSIRLNDDVFYIVQDSDQIRSASLGFIQENNMLYQRGVVSNILFEDLTNRDGFSGNGWGLYISKNKVADQLLSGTHFQTKSGSIYFNRLLNELTDEAGQVCEKHVVYALKLLAKHQGSQVKAISELIEMAGKSDQEEKIFHHAAVKWLGENQPEYIPHHESMYEADVQDSSFLLNSSRFFYYYPAPVQDAILDAVRELAGFKGLQQEQSQTLSELMQLADEAGEEVVSLIKQITESNVFTYEDIQDILSGFDDENLLKQTEKIVSINRQMHAILQDVETLNGSEIYQKLVDLADGDARRVSLALNVRGIKGIVHEGKNKNDYILFDDNALNVIHAVYKDSEDEYAFSLRYPRDKAAKRDFDTKCFRYLAIEEDNTVFYRKSFSGKTGFLIKDQEILEKFSGNVPFDKETAIQQLIDTAHAQFVDTIKENALSREKRTIFKENNLVAKEQQKLLRQIISENQNKIKTLHHNTIIDFKKIDANQITHEKISIYRSPSYMDKPGSAYFITMINGRAAYVRESDHWGFFWTKDQSNGQKESYLPHQWNLENNSSDKRELGYVFLDEMPEIPHVLSYDKEKQRFFHEIIETSEKVYFRRGFTGKENPTQEEQDEANRQYDEVVSRYKDTPLWMKAPNGQPTTLTEQQWVRVRTDNFKSWFGDWEDAARIEHAVDFVLSGEVVAKADGSEFQKDSVGLVEKVSEFYLKIYNGYIRSPYLGKVILNHRGVKDSIGHGISSKKAAAFAIVPAVIEKGVLFTENFNWKNRKYDTYGIVAPVEIAGNEFVCEVVVKRKGKSNQFYLHEVNVRDDVVAALQDLYLGSRQPQPARPVPSILIKKIKNSNHKTSKTLDSNGEPRVFYLQDQDKDIRTFHEIIDTSEEVYFRRGFTGKENPTQEEQDEANRQYDEVIARYKDTPLWMKAPNGEPTKLTERQWVQVRTPNFKEWFGDWEAVSKIEALSAQESFVIDNPRKEINKKELEVIFKGIGEVTNSIDGRVVTFPVATAGKVIRHKDAPVSIVADNLKEIFERAIPAYSEPEIRKEGHKHHPNINGYHNYVTKVVTKDENGEEYFVRFTATEPKIKKKTSSTTDFVHSLFISEVVLYKIKNGHSVSDSVWEKSPVNITSRPFDKRLAKWFDSVNRNNLSKALDSNGEPAVLFHQTRNKDIEAFDIHRSGAGTRDEMMPYGVYLKPSDNDIGLGDIQIPLFTKMTNPVVFQTRTHLLNYLLLNVEDYRKIYNELRSINDSYKLKVDEASKKEISLYEEYYQAHKDKIENRAEAVRLARELDDWENQTDTLMAEWKEKATEKEVELKKLVDDHFLEKGYDGLHLINDSGSFGRTVETFLTFHPENVKSATQNLGTFSHSQNIYYQLANENDVDFNEYITEEKAQLPKLMAVHNLSSNNLVFADKMGGLPAPSIAVLGENQGEISGFGDIFLIGTADMVNPEKEPVFDRDIWSITYPPASYDLKSKADAEKFINQFRNFVHTYQEERSLAYIEENIRTCKVYDLVDRLQKTNAFKAFYIQKVLQKDIAPVYLKPESKTGFSEKTLKSFIPLYETVIEEKKQWQRSSKKMNLKQRVAGRREIEERFEAVINSFSDKPLQFSDFEHDLKEIQRSVPIVDENATRQLLDKELGEYGDFRRWIENQTELLFSEPYLKIRGKKVPYILENIIEVMINNEVKGKEKTLTFGDNKARAMAATRFNDLTVLRRALQKQVKDKEQFTELAETSKMLSHDFRVLVSHFKPSEAVSYWEAYDLSMKALSRWLTRKNRSEEGLKRELERVGFLTENMPKEVLTAGVKAGQALLSDPVPYFEAKPQRIVNLNEFAGAVIPETASKEVRDILEKYDIRVFEYNQHTNEQKQVIRTASAVLSDDNLNTFFQFVEENDYIEPGITDEALYRQNLLELAQFFEKQKRTKDDILTLTGWVRQNEGLWTYQQDPLPKIHQNYPELFSVPFDNTEDARLEIVDRVMQKEGYIQQIVHPDEIALPDKTFFNNALFADTLNTDLNTRIQTAQFLTDLATNDELFLYPKITDSQDFETILKQLDFDFSVIESEEHLIPQNKLVQQWTVRSHDDKIGYMRRYTDGGISLNVEGFESAKSRGSAFILAAITYAHNNGYRFEGDREGYNELGMIRAYEHLLSAALKFGTTKHLYPSIHLREKIDWRDGDDLHNIAELIKITYQNAYNRVPDITGYRYNFTDQRFERVDENGRWRPVKEIHRVPQKEYGTTYAGGDRTSVFGSRTFKRAILVQSFLSRILQGTGSQIRDEILGSDAMPLTGRFQANESLSKIFYHRGIDYDQIRGAMTITPDGVFNIGIFKNANYSTFAHEVGHVLLELYKSKASKKDCPEIIKKDFQIICDYLGVLPGTELKRRHHEKFARSFEAYLREGKAPSKELEPVLSRFKTWLVNIYRNIRQLNVELTPEIRQVFDRMISTDEVLKYKNKTKETYQKNKVLKEIRTESTYLFASYSDRRILSELGAKYDILKKQWYVPAGQDLIPFKAWRNPPSEIEIKQDFMKTLSSAGLIVDNPLFDGVWHYCPVQGGKKGGMNGAYIVHLDALVPSGYAKNFKDDHLSTAWRYDRPAVLDLSEDAIREAELKREMKEQLAFAKQTEKHHEAAKTCQIILNNAQSPVNHAYLLKKGVSAYGIKQNDESLIIPIVDITGKLSSLQYISPTGEKKFHPGGKKKGCFHVIGDIETSERFGLAEGYATAASIYEATQIPMIVAFDAGNLHSCAEVLNKKYQDKEMIVFGDDDFSRLRNTGKETAIKVGKAFSSNVLFPDFSGLDRDKGDTDFNDLFQKAGKKHVKQQIENKINQKLEKKEMVLHEEPEILERLSNLSVKNGDRLDIRYKGGKIHNVSLVQSKSQEKDKGLGR